MPGIGAQKWVPKMKGVMIYGVFSGSRGRTKVMKKDEKASEVKISWAHKLGTLSKMLWGGCVLLCYEHLWHGEVVPFFPFLTAMNNPADTQVMLHEMATVGGSMAVFLTAVWAVGCAAAEKIASRPAIQQAHI